MIDIYECIHHSNRIEGFILCIILRIIVVQDDPSSSFSFRRSKKSCHSTIRTEKFTCLCLTFRGSWPVANASPRVPVQSWRALFALKFAKHASKVVATASRVWRVFSYRAWLFRFRGLGVLRGCCQFLWCSTICLHDHTKHTFIRRIFYRVSYLVEETWLVD